MSVLKSLKLSHAAPAAMPTNAKERARTKVIAHLEQQKLLLAATLKFHPGRFTLDKKIMLFWKR